jgi:mannose-6-phosphate isomerase-like protein (cupin superfamily)
MTEREPGWVVAKLDEIGPAFNAGYFQEWASDPDFGKGWRSIGSHFGISAFGINASEAAAGEELITRHDEASYGGQEELYIVTRGRARFICDGEEVEIAAGGLLFVPPTVKREARATDTPTVVLIIGGTPGKPFASDLPA